MKFLVSSEDCELLLALEQAVTLLDLSDFQKRDVSVLSRRLNKIKAETNFLKKINGRWILTEDGLALNQWTKKAINDQQILSSQKQVIRIATTREFSSKLLIPNLIKLDLMNSIDIVVTDGESEKLLLDGLADIAIDCGTPYHPDIRFKKVATERMMIISSKKFYKKNKLLNGDDYLHFVRNDISNLQQEMELKLNPKFTFSDLASLRSAIMSDLGFGLIPYYVIQDDLKSNLLHDYQIQLEAQTSFGVWWRFDYKGNDIKNKLILFLGSLSL
jgi:DNA-binding transcriptional LysR family regulator